MTAPLYDTIGAGYARIRRPDPRIAARLHAALGAARTVVNVGAGAGGYEPADRTVVAVEPSEVMVRQRPPGAAPVVRARAEALPFADDAFEAGMAVLTVHHWADPRRGLAELRRVARGPVAVLTFDEAVTDESWLVRDYAPEVASGAAGPVPAPGEIAARLGGGTVEPVPVPADCTDGFLLSFWNRPEAVLDPAARAATSGFALLPAVVQERIVAALAADLRAGRWDARHGHLRALDAYDAGLRLVVAPGAGVEPGPRTC